MTTTKATQAEVIQFTEETIRKYPVLKELINTGMITGIDFGPYVKISSSWLVDLTLEQELARIDLETELTNNKVL